MWISSTLTFGMDALSDMLILTQWNLSYINAFSTPQRQQSTSTTSGKMDSKSAKESNALNDIIMDSEPLPPYIRQDSAARQREFKEFSISFEEGDKVQGALVLLFDAALSKNVPTLLEGSPLKGNFRLNLDHPDSISSITFGVCNSFPSHSMTCLL
jgi:hypothetical protein